MLEACLEVIQTGAVVGMQDMGAAGIICSTSEMSAKSGAGMIIHLDKVPTRQKGNEGLGTFAERKPGKNVDGGRKRKRKPGIESF